MFWKHKRILFVVVLSLVLAGLYRRELQINQVRLEAQHDLLFMKTMVQENHLGIHDQANPSFKEGFEQVTSYIELKLAKAHDKADCDSILNFWAQSFKDAHLRIERSDMFSSMTPPQESREVGMQEIAPFFYWLYLPTFDFDQK